MLSHFSHVRFFATLWTVAQLGFHGHVILQARILEWVTIPPPGDLSNRGIKPKCLSLLHEQVDSLPLGPPMNPKIYKKNPQIFIKSKLTQFLIFSRDLGFY